MARERNFRETCRRASRIVCISEFVRHTVLQKSSLPPDRVTTIPIQLGKRLHPPGREAIRKALDKYDLQENDFFFYPANYWPHKNHPMLFTALGILRSRRPDIPLQLVCCGALEEERLTLQRCARRLGLGSRIRLFGFLPEEEFSSLFSSCRALIFPSLYEGFGMPLVEAMDMGKPVLCSRGTSLPEVAGEAAFYFDPRKPDSIAEAMERICADERLAEDLVLKGKSRSARFRDEKKMAREYAAVFREVLK
jgi:glycosyltransferase involved in cell wall biosynthesis